MDGRFYIFFSLFVEDRNKYGILVNNIVDSHSSTLYHLDAMANSSISIQSVANPQDNVDVCNNSALAKAIEENRRNSLFCQNVFYFVDGNAWHLGKMVDLDIMVSRKLFWHNEGIQLAKHNSVINACLERPKLKNTTYASPHIQNENN